MSRQIYEPAVLYTGREWRRGGAVLVENGRIAAVDTPAALHARAPEARRLRWDRTALLPGTVNVHNHSFQSLLRGLATDRPFLEWRDRALYKFSPLLTPDDLYTGAVFAFSEMMKCGVTTVTDFFYVHNDGVESDEAIIRAARDVGIRLVLARTMYDWDGAPSGYVETVAQADAAVRSLMQRYNSGADRMVTVMPAPHSLHAASPEMVQVGYQIAVDFGTRFHIHVAEEPFEVEGVRKAFGCRPVELLHDLGVLDERMVAVHCVWLDDHEKELMTAARANLAYCPSSNMFLADGVTDLPALLHGGVTVGLGTDGACSNNRNSVFEEMRMAALLQKVHTCNALAITGREALEMGTSAGGRLLGLPVGCIEPGYCADFTGVDLDDLSLQPLYDDYEQLLPNIVYGMQPTAIDKVVVQGRQTVEGGRLLGVPEEVVIDSVRGLMQKFRAAE